MYTFCILNHCLILICSFIYKCILFHLNFNQFTENNCVNLLFSFMYLHSHASNIDIMIKRKPWLNSCLLPYNTEQHFEVFVKIMGTYFWDKVYLTQGI